MAFVIRSGKRYRFSIPYTGNRYQIVRYGPAPDASGRINEDDLILIIHENEGDISLECDREDATELEQIIEALNKGALTTTQFEEALTGFIQKPTPNASGQDRH